MIPLEANDRTALGSAHLPKAHSPNLVEGAFSKVGMQGLG